MEAPISFGLWLKERRRQLDLTQHDLANCAGCSVVTIRKIEADERRPSRQVADLLAQCLEIPD
jgi:transcriptional regulator with XRE-family HTH domain